MVPLLGLTPLPTIVPQCRRGVVIKRFSIPFFPLLPARPFVVILLLLAVDADGVDILDIIAEPIAELD